MFAMSSETLVLRAVDARSWWFHHAGDSGGNSRETLSAGADQRQRLSFVRRGVADLAIPFRIRVVRPQGPVLAHKAVARGAEVHADSDSDSNPWQVLFITRLYPIAGSNMLKHASLRSRSSIKNIRQLRESR